MFKTSQAKIEKFCMNPNVAVMLITLISLLMVNKQIPTTNNEMKFVLSLKSYRNRMFYLHKNLPLPGLVYHGLYCLSVKLYPSMFPLVLNNVRLVNFFFFVLTMFGVFWLSRRIYSGIVPWIVVLTSTVSLSIDYSILLLTNDLLAVFFLVLGMIQLRTGHDMAAGAFLGLSVSCSWTALSVYPPLVIFYAIDLFYFLINPSNKIRKAVLSVVKKIVAFILIPISVYILSFWIHYSIQERSSSDIGRFTIEFQSTFKNDDQEAADKYLMDRSIVTILNQKHVTYLSIENDVSFGSDTKKENSVWTIIKVHLEEAGNAEVGEENRYIKDGDLVKIVGFDSNTCLRIVNDDTDDKFKKVLGFSQSNDVADEEDIWQIYGDGYVVARKSLVRFKHYKTSMYLCVRNPRKDDDSETDADEEQDKDTTKMINGSLYASNESRLFYISDNRNHEFFKKNFEDGRPKETVMEFPRKSFIQKLLEHHNKLKDIQNESWDPMKRRTSFQLPSGDYYELRNDLFFNVVSTVLSFAFPFLLLINHVLHSKYGKGLKIGREAPFICILYLGACLIELSLNIGQSLTNILRTLIVLSTITLFGTRFVLISFSIFLSSSMRCINKQESY